MTDVIAEAAAVQEAYQVRSEDDFLVYVGGLQIPSGHGPALFAGCMRPYQRDCFEDIAPSLQALRDGTMPPKRRWWIERTKKASKDADIGAILSWLIAFPRRPFYAQVGAADRDQAGIVKKRIEDLLHYNPWLQDRIEINNYRVRYKGNMSAIVDILSATVAGSHGATPDMMVVNELSHITKWGFVQNLLDNADGVPQGMVIIATNAGFIDSDAGKLMRSVERSDSWAVHRWAEPSPWLAPEDVEDAKKRNPISRFKRLWYGIWSSGTGDAIAEDDLSAAFKGDLKPLLRPESGWDYVLGFDLGISNDHSGVVVLGANSETGRIRLAMMRRFEPHPKTGKVDLIEVEDVVFGLYKSFRCKCIRYDPYQAELMAQRLRRKGVRTEECPFTASRLTDMATTLKNVMETRIFDAYDDEEGHLRSDFGKFSIKDQVNSYRLVATSDASTGHADVGTALVIVLPKAYSLLEGRTGFGPDDDLFVDFDEQPLTDEEINEMPAELREIYDMEPGEANDYDDIDDKIGFYL